MATPQTGILEAVPAFARYLEFRLIPDADSRPVLKDIAVGDWANGNVIGFGPGLLKSLDLSIPGLRSFPAMSGPGCETPSSQTDIWCWVRGSDRGEIVHEGRELIHALSAAFECEHILDGFRYGTGLDLTGYEDGTENPEGDAAIEAAIVTEEGIGLDGSSFVSTQQWVHQLTHFESFPQETRDHIIGRRLSDNEELDDAPASAHVKRTAQESFTPEAFILRRSMPWADANGEGLMFVSFGKSLDAFEAQLSRMTGQEDGVIDGLFRFSRPISGSHFWCPPTRDGKLDLSALAL